MDGATLHGVNYFLTISALVIAIVAVWKAFSIIEIPINDGSQYTPVVSAHGKVALAAQTHVQDNQSTDSLQTHSMYLTGLEDSLGTGEGGWITDPSNPTNQVWTTLGNVSTETLSGHRDINHLEAREFTCQIRNSHPGVEATFSGHTVINKATSHLIAMGSEAMNGPVVILHGVLLFQNNVAFQPWVQNVPIPALEPAYGTVDFVDGETQKYITGHTWCKISDNDIYFFTEVNSSNLPDDWANSEPYSLATGYPLVVDDENARAVTDTTVLAPRHVRIEFTITYRANTGQVGVSAI